MNKLPAHIVAWVRGLDAQGMGIRHIVRTTGVARNTVRGLLRGRPVVTNGQYAQHGTLNGYNNARCRCAPCVSAANEYQRGRMNTKHRFDPSERMPQQVEEWDDSTFDTVWEGMAGLSTAKRPVSARPPRPTISAVCFDCGWPLADHRPYWVHLSPRLAVSEPIRQEGRIRIRPTHRPDLISPDR